MNRILHTAISLTFGLLVFSSIGTKAHAAASPGADDVFIEKAASDLLYAKSELVNLAPDWSCYLTRKKNEARFSAINLAGESPIFSKPFGGLTTNDFLGSMDSSGKRAAPTDSHDIDMPIGKPFWVEFSVSNCSGKDWDARQGYRFGSAAPIDNLSWGTNRVNFPDEVTVVPTGYRMTVRFVARAPFQAGTYKMAWRVLREGVEWLNGATPRLNVNIIFPEGQTGAICPKTNPAIIIAQSQDNAADAINQCIQETPDGGTLEIVPGTYYVKNKIYINKPITVRTTNTAALPYNCIANSMIECAMFVAAPDMETGDDPHTNSKNGFFYVGKYDAANAPEWTFGNVKVDHIVVHGNRLNRIDSAVFAKLDEDRSLGVSASFMTCHNCTLSHSAIINSLNGSGLQWIGENGVIIDNIVRDGGQARKGAAAYDYYNNTDGFTVLVGKNIFFSNNIAMNNTDVDAILSNITYGIVRNNVVLHDPHMAVYANHHSQAGLMIDNFNLSHLVDSQNSWVVDNYINCNGLCHFGIELGGYPWYPGTTGSAWHSKNETPACVQGGTVARNYVFNAQQGINIAGAAVSLQDNIIADAYGDVKTMLFNGTEPDGICEKHPRSKLNLHQLLPSCKSTIINNREPDGSTLEPTDFSFNGCI